MGRKLLDDPEDVFTNEGEFDEDEQYVMETQDVEESDEEQEWDGDEYLGTPEDEEEL